MAITPQGIFNNWISGLPAKMTYGGQSVGFLDEDFEYKIDQKIIDGKVGSPAQLVGSVVAEYGIEITAGFAQFDANMMAIATGQGFAGIQSVTGAQTFPLAGGSNQATFIQNWQNGGLQAIPLLGGSVTAMVVKTSDGTTKTFVNGTDYFVIPGTNGQPGILYALSTGSITPGQTVWLSYSYVSVTSQQLNFGSSFALDAQMVQIFYVRPQNGKLVVMTIPLAQIQGPQTIQFKKGVLSVNKVTLRSIGDYTNNPQAPHGWMNFQL